MTVTEWLVKTQRFSQFSVFPKQTSSKNTIFLFVQEDLENGEDVARCPSCSLIVKVIYDEDFFEKKFTEPLRQKARLELN